MALIDFLILILRAHSKVLTSLLEILGPDKGTFLLKTTLKHEKFNTLLNMQPLFVETFQASLAKRNSDFGSLTFASKFSAPSFSLSKDPFKKLCDALEELRQPLLLEDCLISYPLYRFFVENTEDLSAAFICQHPENFLFILTQEAVRQGKKWIEIFTQEILLNTVSKTFLSQNSQKLNHLLTFWDEFLKEQRAINQ